MPPVVHRSVSGRNKNRVYPAIRTILVVRFDDGSRDRYDPEDVLLSSTFNANLAPSKIVDKRGSLGAGDGRQRETGRHPYSNSKIQAVTAAKLDIAGAILSTPVDDMTQFIDVQPIRSSRRVNSYRIPDELELSLSWKSVPFDSRLIRSMYVLHYEGTITPDTFAIGVNGLDPQRSQFTGSLLPLVEDNLRFMGQVDEISDSHDEGGDVVVLKARDMTAPFLDTKLPKDALKTIKPGQTILQVVNALLETNLALRGIVDGPYARISGELPTLSQESYARLSVPPVERHKENQGGSPSVQRNASKQEESYWDAITDLCVSHGLVPTIEVRNLVLMEPRTLYKSPPEVINRPGEQRFPRFGGYRWNLGERDSTRTMVFGVNVKELRFFRKLGRIKAPAVEVRSFNPDSKSADERMLSVIWPPSANRADKVARDKTRTQGGSSTQATSVDPSGRNPSIEFLEYIVKGVTDPKLLRKIAEQIYEAVGRQEFGVTFSTDEVSSYSENEDFDPNVEPDLLDLKAGDPVRLLVAPSDRASGDIFSLSELNNMIRRSQKVAEGTGASAEYNNAEAYLIAQGFKEDAARLFVRVLSTFNLPEEFRVNTVQVDFDGGEEGAGGFSISIDARDYVRVRADPGDISQTRSTGEVSSGSEVV
jgi:hypothetical protein